jgi:thioredoxin-dependent peroxiredoxin
MNQPRIGQPAPDFTLPATGNEDFALSAMRGHSVVIYFYPRDNTPGCTAESRAFRDLAAAFTEADTVIAGISRDSLNSHERFRERHDLPFALLSDTDASVCELYAVMREKNMYGRRVRGIERSTFLIDREGILRQEWRKVRVEDHADEVLAAVRAL